MRDWECNRRSLSSACFSDEMRQVEHRGGSGGGGGAVELVVVCVRVLFGLWSVKSFPVVVVVA